MSTTYTLLLQPRFRSLLADGTPNAGGRVYTYAAGTTTPLASYANATCTASNTNPVILDASGEADIWIPGPYKLVVQDANGVQLYSADNLYGLTGGTTAGLQLQDQDHYLVWDSIDGQIKNSGMTMADVEAAVRAFNTVTLIGGGLVAADAGDASAGVLTDKLQVGPGLTKTVETDSEGVKRVAIDSPGSTYFIIANFATV